MHGTRCAGRKWKRGEEIGLTLISCSPMPWKWRCGCAVFSLPIYFIAWHWLSVILRKWANVCRAIRHWIVRLAFERENWDSVLVTIRDVCVNLIFHSFAQFYLSSLWLSVAVACTQNRSLQTFCNGEKLIWIPNVQPKVVLFWMMEPLIPSNIIWKMGDGVGVRSGDAVFKYFFRVRISKADIK